MVTQPSLTGAAFGVAVRGLSNRHGAESAKVAKKKESGVSFHRASPCTPKKNSAASKLSAPWR
jgi:hypothetical protein